MTDADTAALAHAVALIRAAMDDDSAAVGWVASVHAHEARGAEPPALEDLGEMDEAVDPTGGVLAGASRLIGALAAIGARLAQGEALGAIAMELAAGDSAG